MNRYDSIDCPICGKPLKDGDVEVCPECGAPYHRSCWQEEGCCVFPELHQQGREWEPPVREAPHPPGFVCSRCGTVNPHQGLFCQTCGNQLREGPVPSPFPAMGGIPLNPYTTPFGGLSPEEEIDGIPAQDLAVFVSQNSHYFLPLFKRLSTMRARMINWAAFLFGGGYYLYRKMYGLGLAALLIQGLVWAPYFLMYIQALTSGAVTETAMVEIGGVSYLCTFLDLVVRLFCGMSANGFYFSHCKRKISRIKARDQAPEDYRAELARRGSTAAKLISVILVGCGLLLLVSFLLLLPSLLGGG